MTDWSTLPLGDVITLKRGYDLPTRDRTTGPFPLVSSSGPSDTHHEPKVRGPGVVTGRYGTIGQVFYVQEDFWPLNTTLYVRDFKGNDPRFVYYFLQTLDWGKFNDKSGVPGVNRNDAHRERVSVPTPADQASIAEVLSSLDDKIDLNHRTAGTLEAMARAVFRDWFVAFGPVRRRMAGASDPHAVLGGLIPDGVDPERAATLAAPFPDRLDDDGLPEGWKRERLKEHVKVTRGLSYKGSGLTDDDDGVPLHNLNSIFEGGGFKEKGMKRYSGPHKDKHRVQPGDVVVANTEQGFDHLLIGFAARVPDDEAAAAIFSHHLYRVDPRPGSALTRNWLAYALNASPLGAVVRGFSNGTTVNMLPTDGLALPTFAVPSTPLIYAFDELTEPMQQRARAGERENRTLAATRDLLLPRLMSGELRVG